MATSLIRRIAHADNLRHAWTKVRANIAVKKRDRLDSLGHSANFIQGQFETVSRQLHAALVSTAGYQFNSLVAFTVPKKGGYRVICVPPLQDRLVQRAVLEFLHIGDRLKLRNSISFGYVRDPDKTVRAAAKFACKERAARPWVYKTDISKFFDRIDRSHLAAAIEQACPSRPLRRLLTNAMHCEIGGASIAEERIILNAGIRTGVGVRQGMPLSPLLANLMLRPLDRALVRRKHRVIRYADDVIALADSESECLRIDEVCRESLGKLGLTIPDLGAAGSKTKISEPGEAAEFLGVSLEAAAGGGGYTLQVPAETMQAMRDKLANFGDLGFLSARQISIGTLGRSLSDLIEGWKSAYSYCHNANALSESLKACRGAALDRLFKKHFGIQTSALDQRQRNFLLWESLTD